MINNRQNGRRRGRGGPRPQGMDNRPNGGGNRPEPRSRGNAPQLHEKYKAMARDAQLAGDRVQTEYFLQFADHYFRILNETRARFDEQRPRNADAGRDEGQNNDAGDEYDDEDGESGGSDDESQPNGRYEEAPRAQARPSDAGYDRPQNTRPRDNRPQREDRPREDRPREDRPRQDRSGEDRPQRDARPDRDARDARPSRVQPARSFEPVAEVDSDERQPRDASPEREARPPRSRPLRAQRPERDEDSGPGIDFDRLPPSIARPDASTDSDAAAANGAAYGVSDGDDAPRPVRRPRRPRESTPAAA